MKEIFKFIVIGIMGVLGYFVGTKLIAPEIKVERVVQPTKIIKAPQSKQQLFLDGCIAGISKVKKAAKHPVPGDQIGLACDGLFKLAKKQPYYPALPKSQTAHFGCVMGSASFALSQDIPFSVGDLKLYCDEFMTI